MYRTAYSNCYTEGDSPVIGGIERLRVKDKTLRQKPPRQTITPGEVKEVPAALGSGEETQSRKELGKLFNVSHEAIRIWEESGKLRSLGWERIPHIKSPVKYSRTTPLIAPR
ncbi:hypothetical protein [Nostoc sp.]|uniref:hypothetical protein n=1 Tax=Nostoc sp. TaxID=1180 RepID=UPI003592E8E9